MLMLIHSNGMMKRNLGYRSGCKSFSLFAVTVYFRNSFISEFMSEICHL